ncbi:hypothetical protein QTP88_022157 [Uroleucon formosanum]
MFLFSTNDSFGCSKFVSSHKITDISNHVEGICFEQSINDCKTPEILVDFVNVVHKYNLKRKKKLNFTFSFVQHKLSCVLILICCEEFEISYRNDFLCVDTYQVMKCVLFFVKPIVSSPRTAPRTCVHTINAFPTHVYANNAHVSSLFIAFYGRYGMEVQTLDREFNVTFSYTLSY